MSIYQTAARILGAIAQGDEGAIAALIQLIKNTRNEYTRREAVEGLGKIAQGNEGAIAALIQLLKNTEDKFICRKVVESLGKIAYSNEEAITALIRLLKNTQDESTRIEVAESLGKIDLGNNEAIIALIQILKNTKYDITRKEAAEILGKIAQGNEEVITALIQAIKNTQDEYSRWGIVESLSKIIQGDEEAIATLIQVVKTILKNNSYTYTFWRIPEILNTIAQQNDREDIIALIQVIKVTEDRRTPAKIVSPWEEDRTVILASQILQTVQSEYMSVGKAANRLQEQEYAEVVSALKDCLIDEVYQNDFDRLEKCYQVIWNCAENLSYPEFYQAWHGLTETQTSPLIQTLNLAQLPQLLQTQLTETNLNQTLQLLCIDGSKFDNRDNPATDIYLQLVKKHHCPKSTEGTPRTLTELKIYWQLLDWEKHPIFIFYEEAKPQGFSQTFLDFLDRFDATICAIADSPHPTIPTFSPQDPHLIQNIMTWLRRTILEA